MSTEHSPTPWRLKIIDGEFVLVDAENFGVELDEETYLRVVTAVNSHAALVSQRDTYRQALENIKEQIPEERSNRRRLPIIAIIIGIIDDALEVAKERQ